MKPICIYRCIRLNNIHTIWYVIRSSCAGQLLRSRVSSAISACAGTFGVFIWFDIKLHI